MQNHTQDGVGDPPALERLKAFYAEFGPSALAQLPEIYSSDVVFQDPVHRIEGLPALQTYFARTVQNIESCRFEFRAIHLGAGADSAWLEWDMHYAHPKLRRGEPLKLEGVTHVAFAERIHYHRDYLDMGGMLYEHVPVIGGAVRWLKSRMSG